MKKKEDTLSMACKAIADCENASEACDHLIAHMLAVSALIGGIPTTYAVVAGYLDGGGIDHAFVFKNDEETGSDERLARAILDKVYSGVIEELAAKLAKGKSVGYIAFVSSSVDSVDAFRESDALAREEIASERSFGESITRLKTKTQELMARFVGRGEPGLTVLLYHEPSDTFYIKRIVCDEETVPLRVDDYGSVDPSMAPLSVNAEINRQLRAGILRARETTEEGAYLL